MTRHIQELLDPQTGDVLAIEIDFGKLQIRMDGTTTRFETFAELDREYVARMETLIEERDLVTLLDHEPARVLDLSRMRTDAGEPAPPLHAALTAAKQVEYVIGIDADPHGKGLSKVGGDPDLPADVKWPGNRAFVAQLALAEIEPFDVSGWLPETGMIYYFVNENCSDNVAIYTPAIGEKPRQAPRAAAKFADAYYRHELKERRLAFRGVLQGKTNARLTAKLKKQLGIDLIAADYEERIFGEPAGEPGVDKFGLPHTSGRTDYDGPYHLALQLRFAGGYLFLGVPPQDLARGDLSRARATYRAI